MKAPYKPTPRDPLCRIDYTKMVQMKDIEKGWQWVCLTCGLRHDIPTPTYVLGEDEKR